MFKTVSERAKSLLEMPEVQAICKEKGEVKGKEWLLTQALITLMYSPEERAAMAAQKN